MDTPALPAAKAKYNPPAVNIEYNRYFGLPLDWPAVRAFRSWHRETETPVAYFFVFAFVLSLLPLPLFLLASTTRQVMTLFCDLLILGVPLVLLATGIYLLCAVVWSRCHLRLDAQGIWSKSNRMMPLQKRAWEDLESICFVRGGKVAAEPNALRLEFIKQSPVQIDLNSVSRDTIKAIISQALFYRPDVSIHPVEMRGAYAAATAGGDDLLAFTELWQSGLDTRHTPTTFVPLEQGQHLQDDSLTIIGQVASGGMSAVYLAQHVTLGTVVLKEFVVSGTSDSPVYVKAAEMFAREARLLTQLSHPRIVKMYDHFVDDYRHYLMLEHLTGRTLRDHVSRSGAVHERLVLDWAVQMADILRYLHTLVPPVVHRDFTPDNLLICQDAKIRLVDFGASAEFIGTATSTIVGKIAFMPPEQLQGRAVVDSDIYAFGGVLYYLLTGTSPLPYTANTLPAAVACQPALRALVDHCLALDLSTRSGGIATVCAMLEQVER